MNSECNRGQNKRSYGTESEMRLTEEPNVESPAVPTDELVLPVPIAVPHCQPPQCPLASHHLNELHASGISDEVIRTSSVRSVEGQVICWMLNWERDPAGVGSGWAIPFDDPESEDCYWRLKLDQPRDAAGRQIKYESPVGSSNRAYFPPGFDHSPGALIVITEGEKKALSAATHEINCLGLTGCWNWQKARQRNDEGRAYGQRQFIDDLAQINWAKRAVIICFDSDAAEKRSVELAQQRLAESLAKRGANVRIARLPCGAGGRKLGLDDALVELGIASVRQILEAADKPELPKLSWPDVARLLIEEEFSVGSDPALRYWRDTFWQWSGRHYEEVNKESLANEAYRFLERIGLSPTRNTAAEVVAGLKAEVEVNGRREPPCHLDPADISSLGTPLTFANQILFVDFDRVTAGDQLESMAPSPAWFCTGSRDYCYDAQATCPTWQAFLESSLPDPDARRLLQQWAGYLVSGRMDRHKLMVLIGAKRAGKSLIASTFADLMGQSATATSTLKALGDSFGLWPLLGKQLLLVPDAQDRGSCLSAVERLKAITGCDRLGVNRKHLPILNNIFLQTRIVLTCNQLPRFLDPSGALHHRLLVVNFERSFAGKEDRSLPGAIRRELPGIFSWAIRGWEDLRTTGYFVEPRSSQAVLAEAKHVLSPISAFLEECCELDANTSVQIDSLWKAWQAWCKQTGHQSGSQSKLGTDLRAVFPAIERNQLRVDGKPRYFYRGLQLSEDGESLRADYSRAGYRRAWP